MKRKSSGDSELAELTASMILSVLFFTAILWVFPIIPIIIGLMYGLTFTAFMTLWLIGLPFTGLAFYYIFRARG